MSGLGLWELAALLVVCSAAAVFALGLVAWAGPRATSTPIQGAQDTISFLFDGEELDHASDAAQGVIAMSRLVDEGEEPQAFLGWSDILRLLRPRFPDLPASVEMALARAPATIQAHAQSDPAVIVLARVRSRLRVEIVDAVPPGPADRHLALIQTSELRGMARAANLFPHPIWLSRSDGRIIWANAAYDRIAEAQGVLAVPGEAVLPGFDIEMPESTSKASQRVAIEADDPDRADWFQVTRIRSVRGSCLSFAIDINPVVEAEMARHRFVQTLTKTFAQLSTGLAIFDRQRQLALFNPALIDLTALPAEFLSARPNLQSFFDRLRENRMMPEPKNYASWRQHIADLVVAAADGRYHETWSLPSGLTYRVTGRPHPDGAIAILFEDISAEISLTRRFRSQLNLGQAVIDKLDEAIAVFSSTGTLTFSNAAFRTLWKLDPESSFAELTVQDAARHMKSMCAPTGFWTDLRDFLSRGSDRSEWFADIRMKDGAEVECRVAPVNGGATLVSFRLRPVLGAAGSGGGERAATPIG